MGIDECDINHQKKVIFTKKKKNLLTYYNKM